MTVADTDDVMMTAIQETEDAVATGIAAMDADETTIVTREIVDVTAAEIGIVVVTGIATVADMVAQTST
jgi:RES domain-containing protein